MPSAEDLDCYACGTSVGQAIGSVIDRQNSGRIPVASIIVSSGRGIWLMWLLVDANNPELPPRAWPDSTVPLYAEIQHAIHVDFDDLGAEARDPARITRVPGSINSVSGQRVHYWLQLDAAGRGFSYTLEQLATFWHISSKAVLRENLKDPERFAKQPTASDEVQRKRRACAARWAYMLQDFRTLWYIRGHFQEGCRHFAAMYYTFLLRRNGYPPDEIRHEVGRLCSDFEKGREPFRQWDVADCLKSGLKMKALLTRGGRTVCLSYRRLSADLKITLGEAELLQKLPAAGVCPEHILTGRKDVIQARRAQIRNIVEQGHGYIPPVRAMAEILIEEGLPCKKSTVLKDYRALGIEVPPRQGKRLSPTATQAVLPLLAIRSCN